MAATWLPGLQWDRMFALGEQPPGIGSVVGEANVIRFPVSDEFKNIAPKVRAALSWGLANNYGPFFIVDDDTYVIPERLAVPSEGKFDYLGWYRADGGYGYPLPYIQGSGQWLSRKAAEIVATSPEMVDGVPDDVAVGRALHGRVLLAHDSRFHPGPVPELLNHTITTHKCLPETMHTIHKQYLQYSEVVSAVQHLQQS